MLAVLAAQTAFGWSDQVPTGPDLDDLYARLSESTFVVKARVRTSKAVLRRDLPKATQVGPNLWKLPSLQEKDLGGTLFTVAVEEVICWQGDFAATLSARQTFPDVVHVFVSSADPLYARSRFDPNRLNRREYLLPGREYLLFLMEPPGQDMLVSTYELEPGVTYYRAFEGQRGAVALPDAAYPERPFTFVTPLVKAVTTFCEAVKGPDPATRIRQLQGVRDFFPDPADRRTNMGAAMQASAWRKSVDAAIYTFQTAIPQPPPRQ